MSSAKVTAKGQITIPKQIRDILGVMAGDRVSFIVHDDGMVELLSRTTDIRDLHGIIKATGHVSLEEMQEAIEVEGAG